MNVFREIRERHVLQAVGVYVGACWVLVEILDRLVERYLLSPTITDVVFWGLYSLLPAVVLIAYAHGKPGKDTVTRSEIVGVPINLIATAGLLITMFSGEHMGSTAQKVMVVNEDGLAVEEYIPKAGFQRSMVLFFWDNVSGDPTLDWLQYGITEMLAQDLDQNPYLNPVTAYTNYEWGFYSRLRRASIDDALDVPLSLQREITDNSNQQYFINGEIDQSDRGYALTARLYKPEGIELLNEFNVTGADVLTLIDTLSSDIREALEVPAGGGRLADDLPLSEQYSDSLQAIEYFISAKNHRLLENDFQQAIDMLDNALEIDQTFALAGLSKVDLVLDQGRSEEAIRLARSVEPYEYKLSAENRDLLKVIIYNLSGEREKSTAILKKRAELSPFDANVHWGLANHFKWTGQLDEATLAYEKVLQLDSNDSRPLAELSTLYRAAGEIDKAIQFAVDYTRMRPDDMGAAINLGILYLDTGNREQARAQFEKANLLRSGVVSPLINLAELEARSGNPSAARKYLDQARDIANSPQQHSLVLAERIRLLEREGRLRDAIVMLQDLRAYEEQYNTPIEIVFEVDMQMLSFYTQLGELDRAEELLAANEARLQAPLNQFMQIGHVFNNLMRGNHAEAELAINRTDALMQQFGLEHIRFQIDYARGLLKHDQQEYLQAAEYFQAAIDKIQGSILGGNLSYLMANLYSSVARNLTLSGDLDGALMALQRGFELDNARGELWTERARLQWQQQQTALAKASMNYALAIWEQADNEYHAYAKALELAAEMGVVDTGDS